MAIKLAPEQSNEIQRVHFCGFFRATALFMQFSKSTACFLERLIAAYGPPSALYLKKRSLIGLHRSKTFIWLSNPGRLDRTTLTFPALRSRARIDRALALESGKIWLRQRVQHVSCIAEEECSCALPSQRDWRKDTCHPNMLRQDQHVGAAISHMRQADRRTKGKRCQQQRAGVEASSLVSPLPRSG